MLKRSTTILALLASAGLCSAAFAQAPAAAPAQPAKPAAEAAPAADLPAARDLLEKAIEATGGRAAIEKIKSRVSTGTMEVPAQGIKASILMSQAAPDLVAMELDLPGMGKVRQGHDGKTAWELNPMTGARVLDAEERESFVRGAMLNSELMYDKLYKEMTTVGTEDVAGKPTFKVRLVPTSGDPMHMFLSKETGLPVQMSSTMKSPMGEIQTLTLIEDYREVDGVKIPFKTRVQIVGMGIEQVVSFEKIEQNTEIPADRFAVPEEIKKAMEKPAAPATPATPAPATGG
jgi:zinc protease